MDIKPEALAKLPPAAQAKLRHLEDRLILLGGAARNASQRYQSARNDRANLERDLHHDQRRHRGAYAIPADQARALKLQREEEGRLENLSASAETAGTEANALLNRLRDFIENKAGEQTFSACPAVNVKLGRGQHVLDAIEATRSRRHALQADLVDVTHRPLCLEEAIARAEAEIDRLADHGRPDVSEVFIPPLVDLSASPKEQRQQRRQQTNALRWSVASYCSKPFVTAETQGYVATEIPDMQAFLCWLMRDEIKEAVRHEMSHDDPVEEGLSTEEREKQIAKLQDEILKTERHEEALICLAEQQGLSPQRRKDANPLAVLEIEPAAAAAVAAE